MRRCCGLVCFAAYLRNTIVKSFALDVPLSFPNRRDWRPRRWGCAQQGPAIGRESRLDVLALSLRFFSPDHFEHPNIQQAV